MKYDFQHLSDPLKNVNLPHTECSVKPGMHHTVSGLKHIFCVNVLFITSSLKILPLSLPLTNAKISTSASWSKSLLGLAESSVHEYIPK